MNRTPLKRKKPLRRGGRRSAARARKRYEQTPEDELEDREFRVHVLEVAAQTGGLCERCAKRRPLQAHHLVSRARGKGWKHLHDPRVNGAALCVLCHAEAHAHACDDWRDWIWPLEQGRERARELYGTP